MEPRAAAPAPSPSALSTLPPLGKDGDGEGEQRVISSIGLYANSIIADGVDPLDETTPTSDLPVVLRQLVSRGYHLGSACPIDVLNEVDNMNYYGDRGTLEMLHGILARLRLGDDHKNSKDRLELSLTKIGDVGSGFGGTSRVICHAQGHKCQSYAMELQRDVNSVAQILTEMAVKNGDILEDQVVHLLGDVVNGEFEPEERAPAAESLDAVVSRLAILHVPLSERRRLLTRCANWIRPGGVLALEDYAESDTCPLSQDAKFILEQDVYVPGGDLPTLSLWKETLHECGFTDVIVEDKTKYWAKFVRARYEAATGIQGKGAESKEKVLSFDAMMGGPGRRLFFKSVDALFNPREPNGLVGIRIFAIKA